MAHDKQFIGKLSGYDGDSISLDIGALTFVATVHRDDDSNAPWENEDGHGPVTNWESRDKRAGELVLNEDHGSKRFYGYAEACKIALRDGWGCTGGILPGESKRAYAAHAAMADYEHIKGWCNDDWWYVGVAVQAFVDGDVPLTGEYDHALWCIESEAGEYLVTVANELLGECETAALARLEKLRAIA